jgi:PleD family two-component response regulator
LAIETEPIKTDGGEISVTLSLGLAVSSEATPLDPKIMLSTADEALYRAKAEGRNRSEMGILEDSGSATIVEIAPVKIGSQ